MSNQKCEPEVKTNLRHAISAFCRWRANHDICEPDECDFCPVNRAYDMAREEESDDEDD